MTNLTSTSETEDHAPPWFASSFAASLIFTATIGLIVGLLQIVNWVDCVFLVLAGVLLSGGILFTVATMQRLGGDE